MDHRVHWNGKGSANIRSGVHVLGPHTTGATHPFSDDSDLGTEKSGCGTACEAGWRQVAGRIACLADAPRNSRLRRRREAKDTPSWGSLQNSPKGISLYGRSSRTPGGYVHRG